ncbi:pentatricopeptide repeat (PPR) superfamily protein [Tasmannia lanceolata]|uniref:pentatricopeptide repeat (PPR) superfamily protein n=1 Tax=Tasmannia lanceolata TaxID=3420 RepID=UPI0040639417
MAFSTQRFLGFRVLLNRIRFQSSPLFSSSSSPPFYTLDFSENSSNRENPSKPSSQIDERFVLQELSDLLSITKTPIYNQFKENPVLKHVEIRVLDGFLSSADKLRGIFLMKLKGKSALESALTSVNVNLTIEILSEVVNRGNLGGESIVSFFNWAIKQPTIVKDIGTYNIILKALGRRKFFSFMNEMLVQMKIEEISPNSETLYIVMESLVRARRVSKSIELFGRLEEFGWKCDCESFNVILQCLCRRSHVRTAISFLNSMKEKISFNSMTYNVIIGGWAKLGRVTEVERNWKAMITDGLNPDSETYSYLIEVLGRVGRIVDAVEVFEKMEEKGCSPETVTYNALISNFISVGDFDECMKYYVGMSGKNCAPDIDTYTKLISSFLKVRKVADALEMFDEMLSREIHPSTGMVTSFIEPLCTFGPPHAAMMFYKKARKVGCRISLKAYKLLLMRLSRFGKCGMVLKLWEEMQQSGYSSDMEVYEYVINGLCNIGKLEHAVFVMEEALRKGLCPSKVIYSKLNNKLLNSNKVEMAYKLFLKVKAVRRSENARRFWRAKGWHF